MHNISKDGQNRSTNIGDIAADMYILENFSGFSPEGITNKIFGIIKKALDVSSICTTYPKIVKIDQVSNG